MTSKEDEPEIEYKAEESQDLENPPIQFGENTMLTSPVSAYGRLESTAPGFSGEPNDLQETKAGKAAGGDLPSDNLATSAAPIPSTDHPEQATSQQSIPTVAKIEKWERTFGPRGKWRYDICDCTDILCCTPLCLMSCCGATHTILIGQLMERMGLDWCGQYNPWEAHKTCKFVTIIWLVYLCLAFTGVSWLLLPFMTIWLIVLAARLRGAIRDRFSIQPEICEDYNGHLEDCICSCCCSCCSAIQMARHTHDEQKYPYTLSTNTGLPVYAPVIFEYPTPQQIAERGSGGTQPPIQTQQNETAQPVQSSAQQPMPTNSTLPSLETVRDQNLAPGESQPPTKDEQQQQQPDASKQSEGAIVVYEWGGVKDKLGGMQTGLIYKPQRR